MPPSRSLHSQVQEGSIMRAQQPIVQSRATLGRKQHVQVRLPHLHQL